ncbi:Xylanase deacetylase [Balamuthia mandrillaris]
MWWWLALFVVALLVSVLVLLPFVVMRSRWALQQLSLRTGLSVSNEVVKARFLADLPSSQQGVKHVALTFDDAPHEDITENLLDLLKEHNCRATFFCIGSHAQHAHPHLLRRMVQEGHEIGNHMMRDFPSIRLTPDAFEQELLETERTLELSALCTDGKHKWFRPGSGWYGPNMLRTLHKHGYECVLGNCYPFDPQLNALPLPFSFKKLLLKTALWAMIATMDVRGGGGDIFILHEGRADRRRLLLETVDWLLPLLRRKNVRCVTLSELDERKRQ